METNSDKDKSDYSYTDCETFQARSIRLGKRRQKSKCPVSLSNSCDRFITRQHSELLSSISTKLKPNNIEVLCKPTPPKQTTVHPILSKLTLSISCFPKIDTCQPQLHQNQDYVDYATLQAKPNQLDNICQNVHKLTGEKRGCLDEKCPIKRKWLRKITFYQRQLKNVRLLRQKAGNCPEQVEAQIDKDVVRTFEENVITKTKITVSKSGLIGEKFNLVECIRIALRLYAVVDPEVSYVQGMNLLCGAVAFHMKQVNSTYLYFRQIMVYGKLRQFYVDNFSMLSKQLKDVFNRQLKQINQDLYDFLVGSGVDSLLFLQYYITLFAGIVEIQYMHIVIDLFMREGMHFLSKFLLALLLLMKDGLMALGEEDSVLMKLGSSYIKSLGIDWGQLLSNCLKLDIF